MNLGWGEAEWKVALTLTVMILALFAGLGMKLWDDRQRWIESGRRELDKFYTELGGDTNLSAMEKNCGRSRVPR